MVVIPGHGGDQERVMSQDVVRALVRVKNSFFNSVRFMVVGWGFSKWELAEFQEAVFIRCISAPRGKKGPIR